MKISIVLGLMSLIGCGLAKATPVTDVNVTLDPATVVSTGYIGNGVQWDPYQLDYGHGRMSISDSDRDKVYRRLDFMRPQFIRVMINTTSMVEKGHLNPAKDPGYLSMILDYCRSRGVTVMFGDWGGGLVNSKTGKVNLKLITHAVDYLKYLVEVKGYDCIRYYNFVNEPNGYWSSTDGDFNLWAKGMKAFYKGLEAKGMASKVALVGPDAAIWDTKETWWVSRAATELGDRVGLYDIHTYPSKYTVNSDEYFDIVKAYRDAAPADRKIVMGEIGLKYVHPVDSALNKENIRRAQSQRYASVDDSQMSVYDFSYGIDMPDALIQTANAGYSGSVAWMLDDAMHCKEERDRLKIWGFWNIFGEEFFGAEQENVRPWYYSWSLMCRNMPRGCNVLSTTVDSGKGVKTLLVEKDGRYALMMLNSGKDTVNVSVKSNGNFGIDSAKVYLYEEKMLEYVVVDEVIQPVSQGVSIRFNDKSSFLLPPSSLTLITNLE